MKSWGQKTAKRLALRTGLFRSLPFCVGIVIEGLRLSIKDLRQLKIEPLRNERTFAKMPLPCYENVTRPPFKGLTHPSRKTFILWP
jgi:hypothetical protein